MKLTISFAGKRLLGKEEQVKVKQALDVFFIQIEKAFPDASFTMLNGLAEGADVLAAESFLAQLPNKNAELYAVLPKNKEAYLEDFKNNTEAKLKFEEIYFKATKNEVVTSDPLDGSNAPYIAQSNYLVANGDLLFAVADTETYIKEGGTLDTIWKFVEAKKTVFCFDYKTANWHCFDPENKYSDLKSSLKITSDILIEWIEDQVKYFHEIVDIKNVDKADQGYKRLRIWILNRFQNNLKTLSGVEWKTPKNLKDFYNLFKSLFFKKNQGKAEKPSEIKKTPIENLQEQYDSIAVHYANMYRGGFLLNYYGFAIAVTVASVALLISYYTHHIHAGETIFCAKYFFIVIIILLGMLKLKIILTIIGNTHDLKKRSINKKLVDFRYVAERLRFDVAFAMLDKTCKLRLSAGGHLQDYLAQNTGNRLYKKVKAEQAAIFDHLTTNRDEQAALAYLISGQKDYHKSSAEKHQKFEHILEQIGELLNKLVKWLVILDLAIAFVYLICHIVCHIYHIETDGIWPIKMVDGAHTFTALLIGLTIVLPAWVAAHVAITGQSEYSRLAARNKRLANDLEEAQTTLSKKFTDKEFEAIAQMLMDEVTEWTLIYEKKVHEM